ncbi:MAG: hypothetical protein RIR12_1868 [Bacteroidota bacterium]|jgi:cbb3-type cytochrome oxidase subunit 3
MKHTENDKPPLFNTWTSWYLLVIAILLILVVLFFLLTKRFA